MKATANSGKPVVELLIDLIQAQQLPAGERLPSIRQLASRFGVSANVVRDGLLQAQSMGLVRIEPREGVFVQAVQPAVPRGGRLEALVAPEAPEEYNLFHLTDARLFLELETVGRAAVRHLPEDLLPLSQALRAMDEAGDDLTALVEGDERFHLGIARIAGNPVYVMLLRTVLAPLRSFRETLAPGPESRERTRAVHQKIYQAIRRHDADGAREAMREHLSYHYRRLMEEVESVGTTRV